MAQVSRLGPGRRGPLAVPGMKSNVRPGERRAGLFRAGMWFFVLIAALVLTASLSLACLMGFRWATTHPFFSVTEIEIRGNARLDREHVLEAAEVAVGENIFELELADAEQRLAADPWVRNVMVKRVLPGHLQITIEEKQPAFWKAAGGKLVYVGASGEVIAPVQTDKFTSLPLLMAESGNRVDTARIRAGFEAAGLPLDPGRAEWVRARGGEIAMYFGEYDLTLALPAGDVTTPAVMFARVWKDLERRGEITRAASMKVMDGRVWVGMR